MSWQEKIDKRLEESKREEAQKIGDEEKREAERIRLGNEALEELRCEEKLSQIRDEIWQMGEIIHGAANYLQPSHISNYTDKSRWEHYPGIALSTSWAKLTYFPGINRFPRYEEGYYDVLMERESISINFLFDRKNNLYLQILTNCLFELGTIKVAESPQAEEELEEMLLQDCIDRGRFLKSRREENEVEVIKAINEGKLEVRWVWSHLLPKDIDYFRELTEKVRQETRKA